jgi:hypothetical protein
MTPLVHAARFLRCSSCASPWQSTNRQDACNRNLCSNLPMPDFCCLPCALLSAAQWVALPLSAGYGDIFCTCRAQESFPLAVDRHDACDRNLCSLMFCVLAELKRVARRKAAEKLGINPEGEERLQVAGLLSCFPEPACKPPSVRHGCQVSLHGASIQQMRMPGVPACCQNTTALPGCLTAHLSS